MKGLLWQCGLKIIDDRILLGYGKGYVKKHGEDYPEMYGYESFVLKELVDGGLVGVFSFLIFYILVYKRFLGKAVLPIERARIHSLCASFLMSAFLTGVSYSFFSLYMVFCFASYYSFSTIRKSLLITQARVNKRF